MRKAVTFTCDVCVCMLGSGWLLSTFNANRNTSELKTSYYYAKFARSTLSFCMGPPLFFYKNELKNKKTKAIKPGPQN